VLVEFARVQAGKTTNKCKTQWQWRSKKAATGGCNGRVYRVELGRGWRWNGDSCFLFTLRRLSIRNGSTPVGSSLRVLRLRHERVTGKRSRPLVGRDSLHFFNPGIVFMRVQWHFPVPLLLHRPAPPVRPSSSKGDSRARNFRRALFRNSRVARRNKGILSIVSRALYCSTPVKRHQSHINVFLFTYLSK